MDNKLIKNGSEKGLELTRYENFINGTQDIFDILAFKGRRPLTKPMKSKKAHDLHV
jgi:hypothetical protein